MDNKAWYIVSTTGVGSRGVVKIQSILDTLGYEGMVWTPMVKDIATTVNLKKLKSTDKTLFPSYVFINTIIDDSKLEQAFVEAKVGKFLKLPGETLPTKISEEDIDHIRELEEANVAPVQEEIIAIDLGNFVEICVGPLIGFKGTVVKISGHSVTVETLIFGRSAPVNVNIAHLSKLTETSSNEEKKAS